VGLFGDDKGWDVSNTLRNKENIISKQNIFWDLKKQISGSYFVLFMTGTNSNKTKYSKWV